MKNRNKELRRYYRQIKSWLPCVGKLKRDAIRELKESVSRYLEENPFAAFSDIQNRFGTPQQIAALYTDEMSTNELLTNLRTGRKITRIFTTAAAIALALWVIAISVALIDDANADDGYGVTQMGDTIIVED